MPGRKGLLFLVLAVVVGQLSAPLPSTANPTAITSGTALAVRVTVPAAATATVATPLGAIAGTVDHAVGAVSCGWRNARGSSGVTTGSTSWSASGLRVYPGRNEITVSCVDAAGNTGSARVTISFNPDFTHAGFEEAGTSTAIRPRMLENEVRPPGRRGSFQFPAPYLTLGYRLTEAADCGGDDCVNPVGYSYWANANNSAGSNILYVMLSLDSARGGDGPNLFAVNKTTDVVTRLGPLFEAGDRRRHASGEGWYFSATAPTMLYAQPFTTSSALQRYDVQARTTETVFDISTNTALFGAGRYIWQAHSSNDDTVHSFTVRSSATFADLGCGVYLEQTRTWRYYPTVGLAYDECQIDRSGRWLVIKEQVDGRNGEDNRFIDVTTSSETVLLDESGGMGHSDVGFGYVLGRDNWTAYPSVRLWQFGSAPTGPGTVMHRDPTWNSGSMNHVSWAAANTGPLASQYACGSSARVTNGPRENEVGCFRLDGSQSVFILAPVMTDLDTGSAGGDDYRQLPKGNLDPTGQYYIWSANLGTSRTDVFMVKLPARFTGSVVTTGTPGAPSGVTATAANGAANLAWTPPPDAGGAAITGYVAQFSMASDSGWMPAACPAGTAAACTVGNLTPGVTYTFRVAARNASGLGAYSAPSNAVLVSGRPARPGAPLVVARDGGLTATVTPASSGLPSSSYELTALAMTPANFGVVPATAGRCAVNGPSGSCVIAGLHNRTTYTVVATASNAAGTSDPSSPSAPVMPLAAAPSALTVFSVEGELVTLIWEPPPDGPATPTGYQLQVGHASGVVSQTLPLGGADGRTDIITSPAPPGVYFVRVQALAGDVASAPSNEVRVVVGGWLPPSAPSEVLSMVHGSTVNLSWRMTYAGAAPNGVRLIARVGGHIVAQHDMAPVEHVTFQGVPPGTYAVALAGRYNGVTGPESAPVSVTAGQAVACAPPEPPSRLRATVSGDGRLVKALWLPPAAGPALTAYELRVNGAFVGALPMAGRLVVAPASAGTYHLSAVARNACGVSAPSAMRTVVVP